MTFRMVTAKAGIGLPVHRAIFGDVVGRDVVFGKIAPILAIGGGDVIGLGRCVVLSKDCLAGGECHAAKQQKLEISHLYCPRYGFIATDTRGNPVSVKRKSKTVQSGREKTVN